MEYFANFFCNVVLFDALFHKYHVWMDYILSIFLILANFAAFLDHTRENADVSKNGGYFKVNFYIYRKYMSEAFSTPHLVALPITSQEFRRGGFLPPTKIVLILRLIFTFTESTCLRLLAHHIWSPYPLPVKSLVEGAFCPQTKIVLILRLIFTFTESTCLMLLAQHIWSLYLLPVKSLVEGAFCPPTKIVLSSSPTTIGLSLISTEKNLCEMRTNVSPVLCGKKFSAKKR